VKEREGETHLPPFLDGSDLSVEDLLLGRVGRENRWHVGNVGGGK
jgi:hypothetical protein